MRHQVVTTIEVPIVRHTGIVCLCGEVFALDVGDYDTYTRQVALVRAHMGEYPSEQHDIEGHNLPRETVIA